MIQVILQEDIPSVGKAGEVVKVKEGFARNFLLPRKKAVPADTGNLRRLEEQQRAAQARAAKVRGAAEALATRASAQPVRLTRAAGPEGKLFGAITAAQIAEAMAKVQMAVDRRQIRLAEPIRAVGTHTVELRLHADVSAQLTVIVDAA